MSQRTYLSGETHESTGQVSNHCAGEFHVMEADLNDSRQGVLELLDTSALDENVFPPSQQPATIDPISEETERR